MTLYPVDPAHWFGDLQCRWLILFKVTCTCGWSSRARWNMEAAADELLTHQAQASARPDDTVS